MRTIVKHQDNFHYMKFQPGDGTIYTVLFGPMESDLDNLYIALGSADYIRGGYLFRQSSARELAREMVKWIDNDGRSLHEFVKEYHYFSYIGSHFNVFNSDKANDWTVAVAVLLAVIITCGDVSNEEDLTFISSVYHNDQEAVLDFFDEWGLLKDPVDTYLEP